MILAFASRRIVPGGHGVQPRSSIAPAIRANSSRPSRSARTPGSRSIDRRISAASAASRPSRRSGVRHRLAALGEALVDHREQGSGIHDDRRRPGVEPDQHRVDLRARPEHVGRHPARARGRPPGTRPERSPRRTPPRPDPPRAGPPPPAAPSRRTGRSARSPTGRAAAGPRRCTGGSRPSTSVRRRARWPSRCASRRRRRSARSGRSRRPRRALWTTRGPPRSRGPRPRSRRAGPSGTRARRPPPRRGPRRGSRRPPRSRGRGWGRRGSAGPGSWSAGSRGGPRGPSARSGRGRPNAHQLRWT